MITRMIVSTVASLFVASITFSQMKYSRANSQSPTPTPTPSATPQQRMVPTSARVRANPSLTPLPRTMPATTQSQATQNQPKQMPPTRTLAASAQPRATPTPAPTQAKPTPTPVPPPDVKAYLDRQLASSKDKKFHMTVNGKDLALTPFHVWSQKSTSANSTSTCIDMRSDDGTIYDIDFVTTGPQVTGIKIHKINGESLR